MVNGNDNDRRKQSGNHNPAREREDFEKSFNRERKVNEHYSPRPVPPPPPPPPEKNR